MNIHNLNTISQKIYGLDYYDLDYEERWVVEHQCKAKSNIGIQGGDYYKPIDK